MLAPLMVVVVVVATTQVATQIARPPRLQPPPLRLLSMLRCSRSQSVLVRGRLETSQNLKWKLPDVPAPSGASTDSTFFIGWWRWLQPPRLPPRLHNHPGCNHHLSDLRNTLRKFCVLSFVFCVLCLCFVFCVFKNYASIIDGGGGGGCNHPGCHPGCTTTQVATTTSQVTLDVEIFSISISLSERQT